MKGEKRKEEAIRREVGQGHRGRVRLEMKKVGPFDIEPRSRCLRMTTIVAWHSIVS